MIKSIINLNSVVTLTPAGKDRGQRIIVFSPHPDDDVIAMGGTIYHLVNQGQEVHVAYQTSGNIAVSNEDVQRFLAEHQGDEKLKKKFGCDLAEVPLLAIKGLVRQEEALAACAHNQIPAAHVHFLNMPFYETGRVEKNPIGEVDVALIRRLLLSIKPHQIYMAGDFNDPHDTHRKCTEAICKALEQIKNMTNEADMLQREWLDTCEIWLYNGAWDEWPIEDIDMAVPMTYEELMHKRQAIQKHQSQMENAPYKGSDLRLFWQRSEDRNMRTAKALEEHGCAHYEAVEAFVRYIW